MTNFPAARSSRFCVVAGFPMASVLALTLGCASSGKQWDSSGNQSAQFSDRPTTAVSPDRPARTASNTAQLKNAQQEYAQVEYAQVEYRADQAEVLPLQLEPAMLQSELAESWTLESLIAAALSSHPEIAAARQRVSAAVNRVPQARALPDPKFNNTFWPIHDHALQTAGGRVGNQMGLSQQVPWPGKRSAAAAVAMREIEVARAEVQRIQVEITEAVKLAYYDLWMVEESIRILEDNKGIVDDLITVAEARYRTGGSQQDVLRAESEADKLDDQLIGLRQRRERARADLGTLVGRPLDLMPQVPADWGFDQALPQLDALVASLEQSNPTLRGLSAEFVRDRAKEALACRQQYPDLQFGLNWWLVSDNKNVLSPVANGHDNVNFTVGVTLPIWREKIDAAIREAAHNRSSTQYRNSAARDRLQGSLRRQLAAAYAAADQQQLLQTRLIPRTRQTLTIATADYQGKRTDFFNLIDVYQELLAHQVQLARTQAALASALATIEGLIGRPLE